jgi:hypothetical protein
MICEALFDKQALLSPQITLHHMVFVKYSPVTHIFMIVETSSSSVGYYRRARLFGISTGLATTVSSLRTVLGSLLHMYICNIKQQDIGSLNHYKCLIYALVSDVCDLGSSPVGRKKGEEICN